MSTYLVVYTMDDSQNNQQGHHNLCKKGHMDKDKSHLTFGLPLTLSDSCYFLEFAFIGTNMKSWSPLKEF